MVFYCLFVSTLFSDVLALVLKGLLLKVKEQSVGPPRCLVAVMLTSGSSPLHRLALSA